jgi:hypothetical protein
MSTQGKMIKGLIKAKRESVMGKLANEFDPMEPWSAKSDAPIKNSKGLSEEESLDESNNKILFSYIKSLGYDPKFMPFAKLSTYSRSDAFKRFKQGHVFDKNKQDIKTEETLSELNKDTLYSYANKADKDIEKRHKELGAQVRANKPVDANKTSAKIGNRYAGIDRAETRLNKESSICSNCQADPCICDDSHGFVNEAGTGHLMSFIKAKGLSPLAMDGNQKKAYSRSSEYKIFKARHQAEAIKETSGMGERADDWNEAASPAQQAAIAINMQKKGIKPKNMKEEADAKDTVCFDIPLLIRVLEFTREDMKTDIELHNMVERLIDMRNEVPLTMDNYDAITGKLKESVSYEPNTGYQTKTSSGHTIVGHSFHGNGTKHANIVKHGETGKYFAAGGSSSHPVKSTTFHDSPEDAVKSKKSYVKEEVDAVDSLTKKLNGPKSYDDIDKMMQSISKDCGMTPKELHNQFVKKHGKTPDDYASAMSESVEIVNELSKSTLKSYVDKVASTPGRGMTPKGTLKSIKAIGGVTKAIRKQYEKPLSELKKTPDNMDSDTIGVAREESDPCWKGYQMVGMKKKGGRSVPNCVPESVSEGIYGIEDSPTAATHSVKAMESKTTSNAAKMVKAIYKKRMNETTYDWEKSEKGGDTDPELKTTAKITLKGGKTMTGKPRDTVEIEPVLRTKINSPNGMKPNV